MDIFRKIMAIVVGVVVLVGQFAVMIALVGDGPPPGELTQLVAGFGMGAIAVGAGSLIWPWRYW